MVKGMPCVERDSAFWTERVLSIARTAGRQTGGCHMMGTMATLESVSKWVLLQWRFSDRQAENNRERLHAKLSMFCLFTWAGQSLSLDFPRLPRLASPGLCLSVGSFLAGCPSWRYSARQTVGDQRSDIASDEVVVNGCG